MYRLDRTEEDRRMRNNFMDRNFLIDGDNISGQNNKNSPKRIGEITGQELSISNIDHGMPMRSTYCGKKLDSDKTVQLNNRSDFNLFDENGKVSQEQDNVAYDDPLNQSSNINSLSTQYSTIASSSEKVIPELYGTDPGSFISANINKFSINLFSLLNNNNNSFCVSPYGLFNVFGALYFASKGLTESDIYDYYSLLSKDNVLEGLDVIRNFCNKPVQCKQMMLKNIILVNNELPVNKDFVQYINSLVDVYPVSPKNAEAEAQNINNFINKLSNLKIHPISSKIINKAQIISLNCGFIRPIWKQPFDKTFNSKFMNRNITMMGQVDCQYDYAEDNLLCLLELRCLDDIMSMGICMAKESVVPEITYEQITSLMKNLKVTYLAEIRIPTFSQQIKMKLTNLLYQNGLTSVFHKLLVPEFVRKETSISDVVQNITVLVENNSNNRNNRNNQNKKNIGPAISNIKFIVNRPFIYYFKIIPTNTIILIGYYN